MRYFRSQSDVYEQVRSALDAVWGNPSSDGTCTAIEPALTAPHDFHGRVMLAVRDEFCEFSAVSEMLPQLLASGAVEEIDEAAYMASLPGATP